MTIIDIINEIKEKQNRIIKLRLLSDDDGYIFKFESSINKSKLRRSLFWTGLYK